MSTLRADDANSDCFRKSLQELKDLRSQLHRAANHCEAACRNQTCASQRKLVLENTRNYICEAIVTVVYHIGSVSATLENHFQGNVNVSQVEQRIDCLAQRILTCKHYALTPGLSNLRWNVKFPRHHQHYISPITPHHENLYGPLRDSNSIFNESKTQCQKDQPRVALRSLMFDGKHGFEAAVPISVSPTFFPKASNSSIGSDAVDVNAVQVSDLKKKVVPGISFLSFLRNSRRKANSSSSHRIVMY